MNLGRNKVENEKKRKKIGPKELVFFFTFSMVHIKALNVSSCNFANSSFQNYTKPLALMHVSFNALNAHSS